MKDDPYASTYAYNGDGLRVGWRRGEGGDMMEGQRVHEGKARQLQRPVDVDPEYLKNLIMGRLDALGYRESRRDYDLSADLEHIYKGCITYILAINVLIEHPLEDVERLSRSVSSVRVDLDHIQYHIRESKGALNRLHGYLCDMEEAEE